MNDVPSLMPATRPASWREAAALVVALVTVICVSDVQGVLRHREEFRTFSQWLLPVLTYAFAAGLALWRWDWVVRVALSRRFAVSAIAAVAAIWAASVQPAPPNDAGVPVLRSGERDRLPVVEHTAAVVAGDWQAPQKTHFDVAQDEGAQADFSVDVPAGWSKLAATSLRMVNLRVAGDPRAECYLTSLPGQAGGLLDNVNRWRNQMGLEPIDGAALAKLPRTKLLGREAVLVELDGEFTGMGSEPMADARMVGAIAALPAVTVFLKMTGPRDVVQRERAGFDRVLASLVLGGTPAKAAPGQERTAPAAASAAAAAGTEGLRWTAPTGWQQAGDRPMRLVTFVPAAASEAECYVTVLPGSAGGVLQNVNRWRGQFAAEPLTQAQLEALPQVTVLGTNAPVVEVAGRFTGMSGGPRDGYAMLATLAALPDRMVFVKLTGPEAAVRAERERFLSFCRSLAAE